MRLISRRPIRSAAYLPNFDVAYLLSGSQLVVVLLYLNPAEFFRLSFVSSSVRYHLSSFLLDFTAGDAPGAASNLSRSYLGIDTSICSIAQHASPKVMYIK
jgi:hypothetical protein